MNRKMLILPALGLLGGAASCSKAKSAAFTVNYVYSTDMDSASNPIASLSYDSGYFSGLSFETDKPLIAGDVLKVKYKGTFMSAETCPATHYLMEGKIISYSWTYTTVEWMCQMDVENPIWEDNVLYESFYVLYEDNHYVPLSEYHGKDLYASIDMEKTNSNRSKGCDVSPVFYAGLYAYNPRSEN